jgi:hypothetical protein
VKELETRMGYWERVCREEYGLEINLEKTNVNT